MAKKSIKLKDIVNESIGGIAFPQALGNPFNGRSKSDLVKVAKEISVSYTHLRAHET